jgi:glycosyltransferase involved in cell wall biosynthesis
MNDTSTTISIPELSFVAPAKDEALTLPALFAAIRQAVEGIGRSFELILVDDGSTDGTWTVMEDLARNHPGEVRAIRLRRNFGKATALAIGFAECRGRIVFSIDADMQDDPKEIPRFLEKLDEGFDVVSGWKRHRRDPLSKTVPSRIFNRATAWISGVDVHDFNCGFKAYRREVLDSLELYGELHRFIPILAANVGYRVGEIAVSHRERRHGKSKYGPERYARGLLDLLTVLATTRYLNNPGHLFGGIGLAVGVAGFAILAYLGVVWFLALGPVGTRPLFSLGILLVILSVQLISLGVVAELLTRHIHTLDSKTVVAMRTDPGYRRAASGESCNDS